MSFLNKTVARFWRSQVLISWFFNRCDKLSRVRERLDSTLKKGRKMVSSAGKAVRVLGSRGLRRSLQRAIEEFLGKAEIQEIIKEVLFAVDQKEPMAYITCVWRRDLSLSGPYDPRVDIFSRHASPLYEAFRTHARGLRVHVSVANPSGRRKLDKFIERQGWISWPATALDLAVAVA